jgi:hypothetical protein
MTTMLLVDEQPGNPKHHNNGAADDHYHYDSTMMEHEDINYHDGDDCEHNEHTILRKYPYLWATIGVI